MKFGALLRNSAAELPELHQLFVSYKQLKKRLKRLPERQELVRQRVRVAGGELPEVDVREVRQQEEAFVQVLDQDVQNFNRYTILSLDCNSNFWTD
jgi:SPX domain protein involved in polyphosphate accumulation